MTISILASFTVVCKAREDSLIDFTFFRLFALDPAMCKSLMNDTDTVHSTFFFPKLFDLNKNWFLARFFSSNLWCKVCACVC